MRESSSGREPVLSTSFISGSTEGEMYTSPSNSPPKHSMNNSGILFSCDNDRNEGRCSLSHRYSNTAFGPDYLDGQKNAPKL